MKVLVERDKFLSDYEVMEHLKSMKKEWTVQLNEKRKKFVNHGGLELEIITNDTLKYLSSRPCSHIKSDNDFAELIKYLNTLSLVKVEKLEIVNALPRSMVHLYSIIEECDTRFEAEVCEQMLEKINDLFPIEEPEEVEEEGEAIEEDN